MLKHYVKEKRKDEYIKGIKEYDGFLDQYYQYEYYYTLNLANIDDKLFKLFTKEEQVMIALILSNKSILDLFNDFKYKKCDDLYMNFELNTKVFDKCKEVILEREKLFNSEGKEYFKPTKKQKLYYSFYSFVDYIKLATCISNKNLYFFSALFLLISLIAILIPILSS